MMFKRLHTTGRNKFSRTLAALLAVALLLGMPVFSASAEGYSVSVSGFELNFDVNTDYYLAFPQDFNQCKITAVNGFASYTIAVEQYATYYPYKNTAYRLGDNLKLGHGRAKVTIQATLQDGSQREYLIALADPGALDYSYAHARVKNTVTVRTGPGTSYSAITTLVNNARVYYLATEGDWCKVQLVNQTNGGKIGYIHKDYLRWEWLETAMPESYRAAIEALQQAHPNWTFSFVDVEMTYAKALEKYGADKAQYINPLNYLNETDIFAFLDIDTYDPSSWNDAGIKAIWANEKGFSKADAANYFNAASKSLLMNPYYIACRAALESGYGTSKYASGKMAGFEGYYNFYGIQCYDSNPDQGMTYAKNRNWNSLFKSIVEGANWIKDQYLDEGATTPYFFRFAGFQNKSYMSDAKAPLKEAAILKRAYSDPNAKAHFILPVYSYQFTDLDPNAWYYPEAIGAVDVGLFKGKSETEFVPNENITRAEFVTALSRFCGVDVSPYGADVFADVPRDQWYYKYVGWAYSAGLVNGISETEFAPDRPITREEMSKLMGGALEKVLGKPLTTEGAKVFADQSALADWAVEWVAKCNVAGIFNGDDLGNFNPTAQARRYEGACVFFRSYQKYIG